MIKPHVEVHAFARGCCDIGVPWRQEAISVLRLLRDVDAEAMAILAGIFMGL